MIEGVGAILAVTLALFSALYLGMSHASASTFTQPLDHMRALYFTVTVFFRPWASAISHRGPTLLAPEWAHR
jgi:hypothetical protein